MWIILILIVCLLSGTFFIKTPIGKGSDKLIAKVGKYKIYKNDIQDRLKTFTNSENTPVTIDQLPQDLLNAVVLEVVVNKKISEMAKKARYPEKPEIRKSVNNYKEEYIKEKYLNDIVYSQITEKDIMNEYDKIVESLKGIQERRIRHILVESEQEAETIRLDLKRGGDFERIAYKKSIDKVSANNGGDIGYVIKTELTPEFGDIAFFLKVNEISKPFKTEYGWHIVEVLDVRIATYLPFDEVKDNIRYALQQDKIKEYIDNLIRGMDIKYYIKGGK
jgi:parvulin-like peptidyl-prolyl isomerase